MQVQSAGSASVTSFSKDEARKQRPHGLNTVALLKVASSSLNIGPQRAMQVSDLQPGGIVLSNIQQIVLTKLDYFYPRVPSCGAIRPPLLLLRAPQTRSVAVVPVQIEKLRLFRTMFWVSLPKK